MDNRFTVKDVVFLALFIVMIGGAIWLSRQFDYQEKRINDIKTQLQQLDSTQKQQLAVLSDIRGVLRSGVSVGRGGGTETRPAGRIRRKNPDGSQYVFYPDIPGSPRHP